MTLDVVIEGHTVDGHSAVADRSKHERRLHRVGSDLSVRLGLPIELDQVVAGEANPVDVVVAEELDRRLGEAEHDAPTSGCDRPGHSVAQGRELARRHRVGDRLVEVRAFDDELEVVV